jgi:hypothetical protein
MVSLLSLLSLAVFALPAQEPQEARKFIISPQAVPSPALRYVLLPPLKDLKTGNAVQHYYRCFAPDAIYYYRQPKFAEGMNAWLNLPYERAARKGLPSSQQLREKKPKDDFDDEQIPATREEMSTFRQQLILDEIDAAARRTHAEWEYLERMKEQGMMLLLPDVQGIRILAELVQIRARLAVMDGEHDRALYHLQTGMAMAQHLNEAHMLISSLTGMGIAMNMLKVIEEFIQTPKAPNLYWALTDLPQPLLDFRQAYAGDRLAIEYLLGEPKQLEERIFTNEEMQSLVNKKLKPLMRMDNGNGSNELSLVILKEYPRAKAWLLAHGRSAADVEKMTATQAVLLFAKARFQVLADNFAKHFQLPLSERIVHAQAFNEKIKELRNQQDASYFLGFYFYGYYQNVWIRLVETDRDIALLRCVELLRHYAAGHDRHLPSGWDEVKDLPIPVDPLTGKRFAYKLQEDHAVITVEAIHGSPNPRLARQYEVYVK